MSSKFSLNVGDDFRTTDEQYLSPQTCFSSQNIFEVFSQDNVVCEYVLCRIQLGADVLKKIFK